MVKADYEEKLAQEYVYASALAYCEPSNIEAGNCQAASAEAERLGMVPIFTLGNDDKKEPMHLVVLKRESTKELIVAFAGSLNGKLEKVLKKQKGENYDLHEVRKVKVFKLFYRLYKNSFREALLDKLTSLIQSDEFKGYRIVFTGHSVGAALSVHAVADHAMAGVLGDNEVFVYTFGQPRVGNEMFNRYYHTRVDEFFRVVNNKDPVVQLPPCIPDLERGTCWSDAVFIEFLPYHPTTEVYYSKNMETYKTCHPYHGEDPDCSYGLLKKRDIKDHNTYFGIEVATLFKTNAQEPNSNLQNLLKD